MAEPFIYVLCRYAGTIRAPLKVLEKPCVNLDHLHV